MEYLKEELYYPDYYKVHVRTIKGVPIYIRPLLEKDLALFTKFIHSLSERSVYCRFLSRIHEFSKKMFNQLIQVDHKNHVALAAFDEKKSNELMLGVSRLFITEDLSSAEISIVVLDRWQGKGIGAELFSRCIDIGKSMGVQQIWGMVLAENTQMIKLAKKLNFELKRESGSREYFVYKNFTK